jgi:hypothetical protein
VAYCSFSPDARYPRPAGGDHPALNFAQKAIRDSCGIFCPFRRLLPAAAGEPSAEANLSHGVAFGTCAAQPSVARFVALGSNRENS